MPPRMIPPRPRDGANVSEKRVFDAFASIPGHEDWIVIHSLQVRRHAAQFQGETDFIVIVPGCGIVVIEAKNPEYVSYRDGDWTLDRVPNPGKSPFDQVDGAIRSLRGFLKRRELLAGGEPIARLVWFTSLGRHLFENHTPGDMQFFEWELAFRDDLRHPAALIEKVLTEHDAWYRTVENVEHDPSVMSVEHSSAIASALLGDFNGGRTLADRKLERLDDEHALLKSQALILDAVFRNDRLFFEGPAGTGKSYLVMNAAKRHAGHGARVLVTCWNELMAIELRDRLARRAGIHAASVNAVLLKLAGVDVNPEGADNTWFTRDLPDLALKRLRADPARYDVVCIDEFQDMAGFPNVLAVFEELAAHGAKLVLAGDARQQILRPFDTHADPFAVARERFPGMVHVAVKRGVRQVAALASGAEDLLSRKFGYAGHRLVTNEEGALDIRPVGTDNASSMLAAALRELLEHHQSHDIVILSPFGERHSLVGRLLAAETFSKDEKWLRAQLRPFVIPEGTAMVGCGGDRSAGSRASTRRP